MKTNKVAGTSGGVLLFGILVGGAGFAIIAMSGGYPLALGVLLQVTGLLIASRAIWGT